MKSSRSVGALAAVVCTGLLASGAHAQTCQDMVNEMKQRSLAGSPTFVTISSSQGNKITTTAGRPTHDGQVWLMWNGFQMTSEVAGGYVGRVQFNDRNQPIVTNAAQSFSTRESQNEYLDMSIASTNTSITLRNRTWGYTINIPQVTCSDGLMFGFGTPVGNGNGGRSALWVFSFSNVI